MILILAISGGVIGVALASAGVTVSNWQFWAIEAAILIIMLSMVNWQS